MIAPCGMIPQGAFCAVGNVWYIWQNDRTCLPRNLGNYENLFSSDIPSPCPNWISPGRSDLHSTSPSCDSWDYHDGIEIIY